MTSSRVVVAEAVRLFAVGSEEVGEAGAGVAGDVLNQDGNGVRFGVDEGEQLGVLQLRDGSFRHALMAAQLALDFFQVVGGEVGHRARPISQMRESKSKGKGQIEKGTWPDVDFTFSI
jgi:hypothetical protein